MTPGKQRQEKYKARMVAEGKRQYAFWLTEEQAEAIKAYLAGKQSLLTEPKLEKPPRPAPESKTRLVPVQPSQPDRLTEYELWRGDKQIGRVWKSDDIPTWRGYPSGFNARQYSGATRAAVVERIERYKR